MGTKSLKKIYPYFYILPAFTFIFLIIIYPVINLIIKSFMTTLDGSEVFCGLANYKAAFNDDIFWIAIKNNLKLFTCVPLMTFISLIVAVVLFNKITGWKLYRSIIFIPYVLAIPVVGIVFSYLLQYRGALNSLLTSMGAGGLAKDWLGNPQLAIWTVAAVIIWKQFGFGVVLFLARLMSVDITLYEAAEVDGAGWWNKFFSITVPQLAVVIEFFITISLIEMLSWVFGFIYVMTAGGPANQTYVLEFLIYKKAFAGGNFNLSMSMSILVLLFALLIIIIEGFIVRKLGENIE